MLVARVTKHADDEQNYSKVVSVPFTLQNAIYTPTSVDEIIILLLYIGETPRQKAYPPRFFAPELSLRLVRPSFAGVNLMNAIFAKAWAVAVVMWR
jgi:hypothetical protein